MAVRVGAVILVWLLLAAERRWSGAAQAQEVDVDCAGYWSPCTAACETSGERTFQITMLPQNNGMPCPTIAPDCLPGDGGTTYLTGCLPSMNPVLQYNRCIDACEPRVRSNEPPDAAHCCRVDYTQCHEWQCVAHCSSLFLQEPDYATMRETITSQCELFSDSVVAAGMACGYSLGRRSGLVGVDCSGSELLQQKLNMLGQFEDARAADCGQCLADHSHFCADRADDVAGNSVCSSNPESEDCTSFGGATCRLYTDYKVDRARCIDLSDPSAPEVAVDDDAEILISATCLSDSDRIWVERGDGFCVNTDDESDEQALCVYTRSLETNSGGCQQWVHGMTGPPRANPEYVTCESLYGGGPPKSSHALRDDPMGVRLVYALLLLLILLPRQRIDART